MNQFDELMATILPEDWRSWMVIGFGSGNGIAFPPHLTALIPSIGAHDWSIRDTQYPGFQSFWFQHMNFDMRETFIAPIGTHALVIATTTRVDGLAQVSTLLAWNLNTRALSLVGPYIGTGRISDYVSVGTPCWTRQ